MICPRHGKKEVGCLAWGQILCSLGSAHDEYGSFLSTPLPSVGNTRVAENAVMMTMRRTYLDRYQRKGRAEKFRGGMGLQIDVSNALECIEQFIWML